MQAIANVLATAIDRARTEDARRRSEGHFRSLIENASDIVTVVGGNGVFRHASPSVARVLGYEPRDLLERSAFEYVHPEDIAAVAEALARAIQRPASPQKAQFRFRAPDGSWRVLDAVGQARVRRPVGRPTSSSTRAAFTERRRQKHALNANKARLWAVARDAGSGRGGGEWSGGSRRADRLNGSGLPTVLSFTALRYPSSTALTLRASVSGTNGFCRNATPELSTPWRTMASSV